MHSPSALVDSHLAHRTSLYTDRELDLFVDLYRFNFALCLDTFPSDDRDHCLRRGLQEQ